MLNGDLAENFEMCRAAAVAGRARVELWEKWAAAEREAQDKGNK